MENYLAKKDRAEASDNLDNPIWDSFEQPSVQEVGNIISLQCGHAARPSETESLSFHSHLIEGGFIAKPVGWDKLKETQA